MPTLIEAKSSFIRAMQRAKAAQAATKWCCPIHELATIVTMANFSATKNIALKEFNAGRIPEDKFIEVIMVGTDSVNEFADTLERDNLAEEAGQNMPAPRYAC